MPIENAQYILSLTDYSDYTIDTVYENGFKAVRTNEWIKTELYCEVFSEINRINRDNVYSHISIATMVIERYK